MQSRWSRCRESFVPAGKLPGCSTNHFVAGCLQRDPKPGASMSRLEAGGRNDGERGRGSCCRVAGLGLARIQARIGLPVIPAREIRPESGTPPVRAGGSGQVSASATAAPQLFLVR